MALALGSYCNGLDIYPVLEPKNNGAWKAIIMFSTHVYLLGWAHTIQYSAVQSEPCSVLRGKLCAMHLHTGRSCARHTIHPYFQSGLVVHSTCTLTKTAVTSVACTMYLYCV